MYLSFSPHHRKPFFWTAQIDYNNSGEIPGESKDGDESLYLTYNEEESIGSLDFKNCWPSLDKWLSVLNRGEFCVIFHLFPLLSYFPLQHDS